MATTDRRTRPRRALVAVFVLVGLMAGVLLVDRYQSETRAALEHRFDSRLAVAARFTSTYVSELATREALVSSAELADPTVQERDFLRVVRTFGFQAAVLLDGDGRAIHVFPRRADLVGVDLAAQYPHLRAATEGRVAASDVTLSAAERRAVVAVATPFQIAGGRRVFSGAYTVEGTPLAAFLRAAIPFRPHRVLLVDSTGRVAAQSGAVIDDGPPLRDIAPGLASEVASSHHGTFTSSNVPQYFTTARVPGTPWRLIATAPQRALYAPVRRSAWIPWVIVLAFFCALASAAALYLRNAEARDRLARSNTDLEEVARTDELTDTFTRRHVADHLYAALRRAERHEEGVAVLMIDVDHFKQINDTYGHAVGDVVLRGVAQRLKSVLRGEDSLGRWGGEEFIVVAERLAPVHAVGLAERIRATVGGFPIVADDRDVPVTVSVGVAVAQGPTSPDDLVNRADEAMYRAKHGGRDRVEWANAEGERPAESPATP